MNNSNHQRLIETDNFPAEFLSAVAKRESWRKEIHRPVYYLHKWWARRLGSVFRGILLGSLLEDNQNLEEAFYQQHHFSGVSVFDPFMGSGTTVGEAHKIGCTALGRDINPVACESVRVALGPLEREKINESYELLSKTVGDRIRRLYQAVDQAGQPCDVLYYFWVKYVPCHSCESSVDLFSNYVIARHAYPKHNPEVQIYCPACGDIFPGLYTDQQVSCHSCGFKFDPNKGPAKGTKVTCSACSNTFTIIDVVRTLDHPPEHKLLGKLILTQDEEKKYIAATSKDIETYNACSKLLIQELEAANIRLPDSRLADGYNTRQAMSYNYRNWRDFFNDRQLLALGYLQEAIAQIEDKQTREVFLTLFSGVLEFNNLFASYKGEGTGAVRHMFSHHILKPERSPLEANVWGTKKSSGSFLNVFRYRLLRLLEYRESPHEVTVDGSGKVFATNVPFSGSVENGWPTDGNFKPRGIYLSCASSVETGLPDRCLDLIVTDPPFFDNVHYSELADFFFAWQRLHPRGFITTAPTTRSVQEVQDAHADGFSTKLEAVFTECHRVLKDNGLFVFTYHHSRTEGWISLLRAVCNAEFSIINVHPIKSEMSVATPKSQAKNPIQLDIIFVCRKRENDLRSPLTPNKAMTRAIRKASAKLERLQRIGLDLSSNDQKITIISQFLCELRPMISADNAVDALHAHQLEIEQAIPLFTYELTETFSKGK